MQKTLVFVVIVIVIAMLMLIFSRSRRILESWAEENDYQILSSEIRWLRRGPFFWTTSNGQVVYYVTARTSDGTVRKGWVRCGTWWLGVLRDKAEARWEGL